MAFVLWILALVLVVAGVINLLEGQILWALVLIVVGCLLGGWGGFSGPRV